MAADIFDADQKRFSVAVSELCFANPFMPERIELEKQALGEHFVAGAAVWSVEWERLGEGRG